MATGKKILVIGGSGFIGKTLVPVLQEHDCEVTVLNRGKRSTHKHQLIADRNSDEQMLAASEQCSHFDAIVDTSAYTPLQTEIAWKHFSKKTHKWIHISSASVYSNYESPNSHKESDTIGGGEIWGKYGRDKSDIDEWLLHRNGDTHVIILRPPYIYGPNNDVDRETFIWSRAEAGLPIITPEKDETLMQFIHVEDLARSIYTSIESNTKAHAAYNVGGNERISIRDFVQLLLDICTRKKPSTKAVRNTLEGYAFRTFFPFSDFPVCLNTDLINKELHWQPKYDIHTGFTQTYDTRSAEELKTFAAKVSPEEKEIAAKLS